MSKRHATIAFAIQLLTAGTVLAEGLVSKAIASPPPEPARAKEIELQEAENAVALLPMSQNAVVGPALETDLARVEAEVCEKDRAIARLQKLLNTPYSSVSHTGPITPELLRLHPYWDPLRGDLRFEKIVASPVPKEAK